MKRQIIEIIPVEATQSFLESKRSDREEFFVNLFEYCNLSCSFCWQDHDDKTGMDRIVENASRLTDILERKRPKAFDCNVMGGELFCDEIDDKLFDDYRAFARVLNDYAKPRNIPFTINWVTNLVYSNNDRVISLVEELKEEMDCKITTSYDPTGRFNKSDLELWLKNLKVIGDLMGDISIVLTRPNIRAMLRDDDEVFKFLYKNYRLYVDYYSPEKNAEVMAPSDTELLQIFYLLVDKYPKVGPINDWINRDQNSMTCRSSNIVLPSGETGKCRKLVDPVAYEDFKSPVTEDALQSNANMEHTFLTDHSCITCEYFQRCGLGCYLHSDYTKRVELHDCVFKITFDYITKGIKHDIRTLEQA